MSTGHLLEARRSIAGGIGLEQNIAYTCSGTQSLTRRVARQEICCCHYHLPSIMDSSPSPLSSTESAAPVDVWSKRPDRDRSKSNSQLEIVTVS